MPSRPSRPTRKMPDVPPASRVGVGDRTRLEQRLLEAVWRRYVRHGRAGAHTDAGQRAAEIDATARDEHACLLHLCDCRRRAHDDVCGLAILEPLLHSADRAEDEFDLVAGVACELGSEVGGDVFYRAGGQDLQMDGGTCSARGGRHRKILARGPSPSMLLNAGNGNCLWRHGRRCQTLTDERDRTLQSCVETTRARTWTIPGCTDWRPAPAFGLCILTNRAHLARNGSAGAQ